MEIKHTFAPSTLPPARRKYVADFLRSWINWAEAGGHPGNLPFQRGDGLCIAAMRWDIMMNPCDPMSPAVVLLEIAHKAVVHELTWQFKGCTIPSRLYPFQDQSVNCAFDFRRESSEGECYLNPQRRAWAKAYLEALETYK